MRFFTTTVAIMAGLSASGSAFVIHTYSDEKCEKAVQKDVNIWDSSCADWIDGFKSFKIKTWGGKHQKAYFFAQGGCSSLPGAIDSGYVDSSTHDYKLGECNSYGDTSVNAVNSLAG
ncbi:hypothetical protein P168DRAFT_283575 [Aspergillus campestris IBT 28561]|uniref:Small secreted protein n=1 Tax=Aspergillus campestris (strain IBT 28561) TaxID=1392248 RepID=A0A2I1CYX6_ASPC2|nr:uncharacterized protein P168DRAFT_283575 [Aspergillus campestris IBT 28561]PKY02832.1 hypothetical protein P168DRAFT_283575 [Aspergillus campestris IBT 28561]